MLQMLARPRGSTLASAMLLLLAAGGGSAATGAPRSPQPLRDPAALADFGAPSPHTRPAAAALERLTLAVAHDMTGVRLDAPPALSGGRPATVVLTLPRDLLTAIQARAAEAGLAHEARRAEVVVTLSGRGYLITPDGEQRTRLRRGESAVFSWTVQPSRASGGMLTADMTGALTGGAPVTTFALGAVTAQVPAAAAAPAPAPARARASPAGGNVPDLSRLNLAALRLPGLDKLDLPDLSRFQLKDLAIPGHRTIDIPGVGVVPSEKLVTTAILALIVILLISIARSAHARRVKAERRRRFHTFEATTTHFMDDPATDSSGH